MPRPISPLPLLILSLVAATLLVSCGANTHSIGGKSSLSEHLVVVDSGNNRVLIYNAPFSTNESASVVLGQPNFTQGSPNQGNGIAVGSNTLAPSGAALDAAGNLWVADGGNCRVVEFRAPFMTNMDASLVIGLSTLTAQPPSGCQLSETPTATGMDTPVAVTFDENGDLWVADWDADRVTEYKPPLTNGMAAALAIGQPDLENSSECNGGPISSPNFTLPPTATTLCYPAGMAFDSAGDLWIADTDNGRVLEYRPPFSTGMAASLELGVSEGSAFTSFGCERPVTASSLCEPTDVAFDSSGNLWIADWGDHRVVEFKPPFTTGMDASRVIGEPNLSTTIPETEMPVPTASNLFNPGSLAFDHLGDLIVGDATYNRVLMYVPPFSNGMAATVVLGQPNMTSNSVDQCSGQGCAHPTPSANSLWGGAVSAVF